MHVGYMHHVYVLTSSGRIISIETYPSWGFLNSKVPFPHNIVSLLPARAAAATKPWSWYSSRRLLRGCILKVKQQLMLHIHIYKVYISKHLSKVGPYPIVHENEKKNDTPKYNLRKVFFQILWSNSCHILVYFSIIIWSKN